MDYKLFIVINLFLKFGTGNKDLRLPKNLIPKEYDVKLMTNLHEGNSNDFTYQGEVKIKVFCVEETNSITIHAVDLYFGQVYLKQLKTNKIMNVTHVSSNNLYNFMYIDLEETLEIDNFYELVIEFHASLSTGLIGFYRNFYIDTLTMQKKWIASTFFQPNHARRAFPCFDEPAFKAPFVIRLGHRKKYTSLSNMPLERVQQIHGSNGDDWVLNIFQKSPKMSTYLVAFVISDFLSTESKVGYSSTTFKIWTREQTMYQAEFASVISPKSLSFFENYLDMKFDLPKQDIVAIPDISVSAVDNWGLILFRESSLLVDPLITLERKQDIITRTICHEMAHQWFGNLVTLHWWSDTWLNEGLATYFANLCVQHLQPQKGLYDRNNLNYILNIYSSDSLSSSYPVSNEIQTVYNLTQIFDYTNYKKGAILIRMIHTIMGERAFQRAFRYYIKKHQFQNIYPDDLWETLAKEIKENVLPSNISLKTIMDSWMKQAGFPVVTVLRDYYKGTITISQERFFKNSEKKDPVPCWWIPITYTTENEQNFNDTRTKFWLPCPKESITFNFNHPNEWILFNIKLSGLYIVNYDLKNWNMLIKRIHLIKDDFTRAGLISHIMKSAESGKVPYKIAFNLYNNLKKDNRSLVNLAANKEIMYISKILRNVKVKVKTEVKKKVHKIPKKKRVRSQVARKIPDFLKPYRPTGIPSRLKLKCATHFPKYFSQIYNSDCMYSEEECYYTPEDNQKVFLSSIRPKVINSYCKMILNGDAKHWNNLWKKFLHSVIPTDQTLMLKGLACSTNATILRKYVNKIFEKNSLLKIQDILKIFTTVASNPKGYKIAKDLLYKRIKDIHNLLQPNGDIIGFFVNAIASQIFTKIEYEQFLQFLNLNRNYLLFISNVVQESVELIQNILHWIKTYYPLVSKLWLEL